MAEVQETQVEQQVNAQKAEFEEVDKNSVAGEEPSLDILLDINMPIDVNIGKTEIPFRQLLQLGPGAVLQLEKPIGQPAELYVQDIKFATGDIVVVNECFAVRIKEVIGMEDPEEMARQAQQQ